MSHYKNIEALGLKVEHVIGFDFIVRAYHLEKILESAQTVYSNENCQAWGLRSFSDTHTAKLLCIQELKREPVKLQWHETIDDVKGAGPLYNGSLECLRGKRVRVTVEEIEIDV